jgi:hypothetical protein
MEDQPSERLIERFVQPWYLEMMRLNACEHGLELAAAIREISRDADDEVVLQLLRLGWRSQVMGAWFSITRDSAQVKTDVLRALRESHGSLDAPPLATASVVLAGPDSMATLTTYYEADVAASWGAADIIREAAHYLQDVYGVQSTIPVSANGEHLIFDRMIAVARAIRME